MRRAWIAPMALAFAALLAASCGDSEEITSSPTPAATQTPMATAEPTVAPTPTPTPTASAEPGTPTPAPVYTLSDFVTALDDLGLKVELSSTVLLGFAGPPLSAEVTHLTLEGLSYLEHGVEVFVYPDEATLIDESGFAFPYYLVVELPEGKWYVTPRSFSLGNLVVVVISDDAGLIATVKQAVDKLEAGPPSDAEPSATKTPVPPSRVYTRDDIVSSLEDYGLHVVGFSPRTFFGAIRGSNLEVSEFVGRRTSVEVYEFEDEATRVAEAGHVTTAQLRSRVNTDWGGPPYAFARGNLLVIVVTFHGGFLAVVEEAVATLP